MRDATVEWKRLVTEGVVIVASILIAFTIDAWWDERRQFHDAEDQVRRVTVELRANLAILNAQQNYLLGAAEATREFIELFGPDPAAIEISDIAALVGRMYSLPTLSLERSAADDFLSSGQLTEGRWAEFRRLLASTLSYATRAENSSMELRQMRPEMLRLMQSHISGLDLARDHPLMKDYQPSRFDADTHGLLSDRQVESVIGNYAIRVEINRWYVRDLIQQYESMIENSEQPM